MRTLIFAGFLFLAILFVTQAIQAQRYVIGVSPSFIDLGTLKRGESKVVRFYIVSPENQEVLVYLKEEPGNPDFLVSRFPEYVANFSEEDASKWISYFSNPVILKPQETPLETQIGKIRTWREVSFLIKIPNDAEPGYHLISIEPQPQIARQTEGQVGIGLVSVSKVNILFYVEGEARREGEILEVLSEEDKVKVYFKNTGTVTIFARANGEVYANNEIINFSSSFVKIKPGELGEMVAFLDKKMNGEFEARVKVSFLGGQKEKITTLFFVSEEKLPITKKISLDFLVILLVLVAILLVSYWFYRK